jgi:hypothetical protein
VIPLAIVTLFSPTAIVVAWLIATMAKETRQAKAAEAIADAAAFEVKARYARLDPLNAAHFERFPEIPPKASDA